jgi:hypothetical protein
MKEMKKMEVQMNMKKVRNQIQVVLVLVVLVIVTTASSYGAIVKGSTIGVAMKDGIEFKGELLAVSGRTLVLFDNLCTKESRVDIDEVKKLTVFRKSRLGKTMINGGTLGAIVSLSILAGEDQDDANDYRALSVPLFAFMSGGVGMLSSLFVPGNKNYPIENMSAADIDVLLTHLARSTRENLPWNEASRNGWLGRFRISWRPYFNHKIDMNIPGTVDVPAGPLPSDNQSDGTVYLKSQARRSDGTHLGRIRVDYALRNNFSLGFEYVSLGTHNISGGTPGAITMTRDQKDYSATLFLWGENTARVGLIGVNYDIPAPGENSANLRIETGVGLSFIRMDLGNEYYTDWSASFNRSYNMVNPAFQVGLSVDFYPNDPISTGMYASFMYAPASFPGLKENISLGFVDAETPYSSTVEFRRDAVVTVPKANFSMGGFSLGFFIRIR